MKAYNKKFGVGVNWNTHKSMTYCKCKKIWVDGCATLVSYERSELEIKKYPCGKDYVRVGGNEADQEEIKK